MKIDIILALVHSFDNIVHTCIYLRFEERLNAPHGLFPLQTFILYLSILPLPRELEYICSQQRSTRFDRREMGSALVGWGMGEKGETGSGLTANEKTATLKQKP